MNNGQRLRIIFITASSLLLRNGYRTRVLAEIELLAARAIPLFLLVFTARREWLKCRERSRLRIRLRKSGVRVLFIPLLPDFHLTWLYELNNLVASIMTWLCVLFWRATVVHAHAARAGRIAALVRAWVKDLLFIYDAHGIGPEEAGLALGGLEKHLHSVIVQRIARSEAIAIEKCDSLIAVSAAMAQHFHVSYGVTLNKQVVVPCCVNLEQFAYDPETRLGMRVKLYIQDRFVWVYAGGSQPYQCIHQLVQLFALVRAKNSACFLLMLSDIPESQFSELAQQLGLAKDSYMLFNVPHEQVGLYLQAADVGLLLRKPIAVNRVASPTKFGEYLTCAVPVIISQSIGDFSSWVDRYSLGLVFDESDESCQNALSQIETFLRDVQAHREDYAQRCRQFAVTYLSWQVYVPYLLQAYNESTTSLSMSTISQDSNTGVRK